MAHGMMMMVVVVMVVVMMMMMMMRAYPTQAARPWMLSFPSAAIYIPALPTGGRDGRGGGRCREENAATAQFPVQVQVQVVQVQVASPPLCLCRRPSLVIGAGVAGPGQPLHPPLPPLPLPPPLPLAHPFCNHPRSIHDPPTIHPWSIHHHPPTLTTPPSPPPT
jgi:hypothetical protein